MTDGGHQTNDRLFIHGFTQLFKIDRVVGGSKFESLWRKLPSPIGDLDPAPFVFVWIVLFIDHHLIGAIQLWRDGYHPYLQNPGSVLIPFGYTLVVGGILIVEYESNELELASREDTKELQALFDSLMESRIKYVVVVLAVTFRIFKIQSTGFDTIASVEGPVLGFVKWVIITPFVIIPIVSEFCIIVLGLHFWIPRELRKQGIDLNLDDPKNMGGLYPIGKLLKYTSQIFFLSMVVYSVVIVALQYFQDLQSNPLDISAILIGWVFGIAIFAVPIYWIHLHMSDWKESKQMEIIQNMKQIGETPGAYPDPELETQEELMRYMSYNQKLRRVDQMSEYPVDITIVQEIVAVAIIPYLVTLLPS